MTTMFETDAFEQGTQHMAFAMPPRQTVEAAPEFRAQP